MATKIQMIEELKEFGLTNNESKVYLSLLELKESTVTPIKDKSELHMSRVYEALSSLVEKGVISYYMRNGVKNYKAQDPQIFLELLEEKKEKMENAIPKMQLLLESKKSNYSTSIHEGYKAVKNIFDVILSKLEPSEEILVLGALEENAHFMGRTFFQQYNERRIKKKIKMKILFNTDAKATAKKYSSFSYTEARVLPNDMATPSSMNVYPKSISILLLEDKPIVFQIHCKKVAESYRKYFYFLWENSKKV